MSKNKRIKLDLLSNISEDIIESVTRQRIQLLDKLKNGRRGNHRMIAWMSVAAMLLVIFSIPIIMMLSNNGKQIPVYQGMTVSSENLPQESVLADQLPYTFGLNHATLSKIPQAQLLAFTGALESTSDSQVPIESETAHDFQASSGAELYYTKPNEDFYITVHIENPDHYEILSFTLNGEKYSSYMFEKNSDMENLILKCNTGDATGIVEYTIDAIKYIDGTEIKDVIINGDQTVRIGVYTEEQPKATLKNEIAGYDTISFDVKIVDSQSMLELSDSRVYAALYQGDSLVQTQEIPDVGTTLVRFEGLEDETEYRYTVVAFYDAFDGSGLKEYILAEETIETEPIVSVKFKKISYTDALYSVVWNEAFENKTLQSLAVYRNGEKIRDLTEESGTITDLLADNQYTVRVELQYNGKMISKEIDFKTKTVAQPTVSISDIPIKKTSVSFDLSLKDPLQIAKIKRVELLLGDKVVAVTEKGVGSHLFEGLEAPCVYTIRVVYQYDLLDGKGVQNDEASFEAFTQSEGLEFNKTGRLIAGIGTCTDTELCINMAVASNAFKGNTKITSVTFGDGVTRIPNSAFSGCTSLEKVTFSDSIKSIGSSAFYGCESLKSVTSLPGQLEVISSEAFFGCYSLTWKKLVFPESLTSIDYGAFEGSVIECVVIPEGVEYLSDSVFSGTKVFFVKASRKPSTWGENWNNGATVVWNFKESYTDSQGVTYAVCNDGSKTVVSFNGAAANVVLEEGVTTIASLAFDGCSKLETITFPESLLSIGDGAFQGTGLVSIVLPRNLTSIGAHAFYGCENLTSVVIPASVTQIGYGAFGDCNKICVYAEAATEPMGWDKDWIYPNANVVFGYVKP